MINVRDFVGIAALLVGIVVGLFLFTGRFSGDTEWFVFIGAWAAFSILIASGVLLLLGRDLPASS